MNQHIIIIAGMHRSGTSLSGNLLEQSGLFIGEQLLSHGFDNKKGHFEDTEILKIHEDDLKLKHLDSRGLKGKIKGELCFEAQTEIAIDQILIKRSNQSLWGWKEPRTTLYLQAWKEKLPESKCIAIYRGYDDVARSLIRRYNHKLKYGVAMSRAVRLKHVLFYPVNILLKKREAYKAWYIYNKNILAFKKAHPNDVIIVELSHFLKAYNTVIDHVNHQFGVSLHPINVDTVYDGTLLNTSKTKGLIYRGFSSEKLKQIAHQLKQNALWT